MLSRELCFNPGMMSAVLARSLLLTCSCASAVAFAMCSNSMWKTFNDCLPVCIKGSVAHAQLDVTPESGTMQGKVSLRMSILVVFIVSFFSLYIVFCLEA